MVAAGTVAGFAGPAAAAPTCRIAILPPYFNGFQVETDAFFVCSDPDNPNDGMPATVVLDQLVGGTWHVVATGYGEAVYTCRSNTPRSYKAAMLPSKVTTFPCA